MPEVDAKTEASLEKRTASPGDKFDSERDISDPEILKLYQLRRDMYRDLKQLREGKIGTSQARARAIICKNIIESVKVDLVREEVTIKQTLAQIGRIGRA